MSRASTAWPPVVTELPQPHPQAPPPGTVLPAHYDRCFGCGGAAPNGLRLHATVGDGMTVHARFAVAAGHQGAPGLAHGGLLTAAFDEALGSLNALTRRPAVTGKLETDFLRPVPVGTTLHIVARIDGIAGRKIYSSAVGRLGAPDGPVAVRARALFVIVGIEHFVKHGSAEYLASAGGTGTPGYDVNP